jgi:hypothetical protein
MVHRAVVFVVAGSLALGGCSATRARLPGWLGGTPQAPSPTGTEQFYVGADGLAVHAEASGSSRVIGRLSLRERVRRSELVRGYAHVVADTSGLDGWVDNGKLLWRLPAAGAGAAPVREPPVVDGETPVPAAAEEAVPVEALEDQSVPPASAPPPSAPETPPAPAQPVVPKDFDPF